MLPSRSNGTWYPIFQLSPATSKDSDESWRVNLAMKKQLYGPANRIAVGGKLEETSKSDKQGGWDWIEAIGHHQKVILALAIVASSIEMQDPLGNPSVCQQHSHAA